MRILTWNMQGGHSSAAGKETVLLQILNSGEYDVVCVQEATAPLASFKDSIFPGLFPIQKRMPPPRYPPRGVNHIYEYTAVYYPWGANLRCSQVIYIKTAVMSATAFPMTISATGFPGTRGMLCVPTVAGRWVCSVHLISGAPAGARGQFTSFITQANANVLFATGYVVVGDFNINAFDPVHYPPLPAAVPGGTFHHSAMVTQVSGGCLDYMYARVPVIPLPVAVARVDMPGTYSDHSRVSFDVPGL